MTQTKPGKLICVGTGMRMAGQVTPLARSNIETADMVVSAVPKIFTRDWIQGIAKEFICMLGYYSDCDVDGQDLKHQDATSKIFKMAASNRRPTTQTCNWVRDIASRKRKAVSKVLEARGLGQMWPGGRTPKYFK
jgi:hypothetical protein